MCLRGYIIYFWMILWDLVKFDVTWNTQGAIWVASLSRRMPGIFWKGYRDCGRWFARAPDTSESCCGKGRKVRWTGARGIWDSKNIAERNGIEAYNRGQNETSPRKKDIVVKRCIKPICTHMCKLCWISQAFLSQFPSRRQITKWR